MDNGVRDGRSNWLVALPTLHRALPPELHLLHTAMRAANHKTCCTESAANVRLQNARPTHCRCRHSGYKRTAGAAIPGVTHHLGIMMSNTATFTLHIKNIVKMARDKMGWVESVSVAGALSHADTLEISCLSPTRVLLPALESMESNRHTSYRSYSTNVYIQDHWSTALKLLGKTAQTQIVLSPETPWTLYNYIYFQDNTAYGAKY